MEIAKTRFLLEEDERLIKCYEGEIEGYNTRLKQLDEDKILTEIQKKRHEITTTEGKLANLNKELKEIDTDDLVKAAVWSVNETWQLLKSQSKAFEVTSDWEIIQINTWTNGHCQFKNVVQSGRTVSGVVEGEFMRGMYARITLLTRQDYKFAKRIVELKQQIAMKEREQCEKQRELQASIEHHTSTTESIKLLQSFIDEKTKRIDELSGVMM